MAVQRKKKENNIDTKPCEEDIIPYGEINKDKILEIKFQRYGLKWGDKEGYLRPACKGISNTIPDDGISSRAPIVSKYRYHLMPLRDGYLYIYNETLTEKKQETGGWRHYNEVYKYGEYKVNDCGNNRNILKYIKNDLRICKIDDRQPVYDKRSEDYTKKRSFIRVRFGDVVWVAFSDVQWSANYVNYIFSDEGKEDLKKRFQKIDTQQWGNYLRESLTEEDLFKLQRNPANDRIETYTTINPKPETIKNPEFWIQKVGNSVVPRFHLNIHDPMGAVEAINKNLTKACENFEALVKKIQTSNLQGNAAEENYCLYTLGVMLNQLLYNEDNTKNKEFQDKHRELCVNDVFLKQMLGNDDRRKLRYQINELRNSLLDFMKGITQDEKENSSKKLKVEDRYYNFVLTDYIENTTTNLQNGKFITPNHIKSLKYNPASLDKTMDVKKDDSEINNKVLSFIDECCKMEHPICKLITKECNLQKIIDEYNDRPSTRVKVDSLWDSKVLPTDVATAFDFVLSNFTNVLLVFEDKITKDLSSAFAQAIKNVVKYKDPSGRLVELIISGGRRFNDLHLIDIVKEKIRPLMPDIVSDIKKLKTDNAQFLPKGKPIVNRPGAANEFTVYRVSADFHDNHGKYIKIKKIMDNPVFSLLSCALSTISVISAYEKFLKEKSISTGINLIAVHAEITYSLTRCYYLYSKLYKKQVETALFRISGKASTVTTLFNTILCAAEARDAFIKNNAAAGFASLFGAAAGIGMLIGTLAASAATAGIAFVIGILAAALVSYFSHTALQSYLYNCILTTEAMNKKLTATEWAEAFKAQNKRSGVPNWNTFKEPGVLINQLIKYKEKIVDTEHFPKLVNMKYSLNKLTQFLIRPTFKCAYRFNVKDDVLPFSKSISSNYEQTINVTIKPPLLTFDAKIRGGLYLLRSVTKDFFRETEFEITERGDDFFKLTFNILKYHNETGFQSYRMDSIFFFYQLITEDDKGEPLESLFPTKDINQFYVCPISLPEWNDCRFLKRDNENFLSDFCTLDDFEKDIIIYQNRDAFSWQARDSRDSVDKYFQQQNGEYEQWKKGAESRRIKILNDHPIISSMKSCNFIHVTK